MTQVCKCLGTKLNPRDTLATWNLQTSAHHHVYHHSKHKWNNKKKNLGTSCVLKDEDCVGGK